MDMYIKQKDVKNAFLKGFSDAKKYPEFVNWLAKEADRITKDMKGIYLPQDSNYGKWQYSPHRPSYHAYMCSACGRCNGEKKPFCPNCGKEMITEDLNKL